MTLVYRDSPCFAAGGGSNTCAAVLCCLMTPLPLYSLRAIGLWPCGWRTRRGDDLEVYSPIAQDSPSQVCTGKCTAPLDAWLTSKSGISSNTCQVGAECVIRLSLGWRLAYILPVAQRTNDFTNGVVDRPWVLGREFESHVHHVNAF